MAKPSIRELLRDMEPRDEAGMVVAARVERVLALHNPVRHAHADRGFGHGSCCLHCSGPDCAPWPCPTVRALEGEE